MKRRLAAILAADVVGYSRLVRQDEDGTLNDLKRLRNMVIDPTLEARGGRIVKLMGDGLLAEFPSAFEAVRAAMEIQQAMADRPSDAGITFRVGINLGDVVVDDGDIYGDGVNVAARLEAEAVPGGLCVSETVHEQIRGRLTASFADLGARTLKNIDVPVRVWGWTPSAIESTQHASPLASKLSDLETPSVAVLPFSVYGSDPVMGFLAEGMVEDIITVLSKIPELTVTSSSATFAYKGKSASARDVGRNLEVRHVLEGSVRQLGAKIRVTTRLTDVESGEQRWADTYDGHADDPFTLIDTISYKILETLDVHLAYGDQAHVFYRGKWTLRAYQAFRLGVSAYLKFTRRAHAEARAHLQTAISECPEWAPPRMALGWCLADEARWNWAADPEAKLVEATRSLERALEIDPLAADAACGLGYVALLRGQAAAALDSAAEAVARGPNHGEVLHSAAMIANFCGRPELGLEYSKHAIRCLPFPQSNALTELGHSYILVDEPGRAIHPLRQALLISPFWRSARCLVIWALDVMEDNEAAHSEAGVLLDHAPRFRLARWAKTQPYLDRTVLDLQIDALRRAGVPE